MPAKLANIYKMTVFKASVVRKVLSNPICDEYEKNLDKCTYSDLEINLLRIMLKTIKEAEKFIYKNGPQSSWNNGGK